MDFKKWLKNSKAMCFAALVVPLGDSNQWQKLSFSSLPKHELSFSKDGMDIKVKSSAMPLIFPLEKPTQLTGISIEGEIDKLLNLPKGPAPQWKKDGDDFVIKVGLVLRGKKTLGWLEKKVAPDWVLKLFSLAPKGVGVERIYFLTAVQTKDLLGKKRNHPLKEDLLTESNIWLIDKPGKFKLEKKLDIESEVLALWISVDGDETKSSYNLKLSSLTLEMSGTKSVPK